jgi:hypothetical protein
VRGDVDERSFGDGLFHRFEGERCGAWPREHASQIVDRASPYDPDFAAQDEVAYPAAALETERGAHVGGEDRLTLGGDRRFA